MAACCLVQVSLPPRHDRKGDQQNHDSGGTDNVRHHGKQAGSVARVRPDEADDCPHDEHGDRCREPVEDPTRCDAVDPSPVRALSPTPRAEPQLDAYVAGSGIAVLVRDIRRLGECSGMTPERGSAELRISGYVLSGRSGAVASRTQTG
jgi:hypothetical protein